MSIVRGKFLGFVLALFCALPLVLCVGGCDQNPTNTSPSEDETISNVYQTVQQNFYDFNNYRADITCRYNYRHVDSDAVGSTIKDEAGTRNLQLHIGENGIYFYVQPKSTQDPIVQAAFMGDAIYKYGDKTEAVVPFDLDMTGVTGALIYYFVQNGFVDFANLATSIDSNALTLDNSDERITLTASINLKNFVNQLIDNCETNADQQIIVFLNEFIRDTFNKNTSVQALISGFCDSYTNQTTVGDLISYINTALGVNLTQPLTFMFDIISFANNVTTEDYINDRAISKIIQSDKTGAQIYSSIMDKLGANDLTLSNILDGTYVSTNQAINDVLSVVADVVNEMLDLYSHTDVPTVKDMVATWSVVMNKQYEFESMQLKVLGNLGVVNAQNVDVATTAVDLSINVAFSNVGITDVSFPGVVDTATFRCALDLADLEATATQYQIDLSDYPPFSADLDFYADVFDSGTNANVSTLIATYDVATQLFIVQAQYLKDKYLAGENDVELTATDNTTQGTYTFKFSLQNSTL